jgi:GntR family transcriptional repressor for pyruvate dehydrogenase complex
MSLGIVPLDLSKRASSVTEVTRALVSYLLAGEIQPGQRIPPERRLAEALGIGRSSVREGLKTLTILGLVEVRQGNGTFLKRADSEFLPEAIEWGLLLGVPRTKDFIEARQELEVILAGLAADRRQEADLSAMRECIGVMDEITKTGSMVPESRIRFNAADVEFHACVWAAAGNSALQRVMVSIRSLLEVWIRRVMEAEEEPRRSFEEHVPIFKAIESVDREQARAAMARHMSEAAKRLMATIEVHEQNLIVANK